MEEIALNPVEPEEQSEMSPEDVVSDSMKDYYALQRELLVTTVILIGLIFPAVWFFYNLMLP